MSCPAGGATAIVTELAAAGTGVMFGVPGGGPSLDVLGAAAEAGDVMATVDAGTHMLVVMPLWEVTEPRRLLISSGLATMGFALPAAMAAAQCAPARPWWPLPETAALGMTLAEIETAVRLRLRIAVIVFNDGTLSLIKIKQRPDGQGGSEAVDYRPVSFAAVAAAMGAASASVASEAELAGALETAMHRDGPTVIDVAVDPASYPAVMELSRGAAGRRPIARLSPPAE